MPDKTVRYRTVELNRALGVSFRVLQWWDEKKVIMPAMDRHTRVYTHDEAVLVGVVHQLRKAGLSLQKIRRSLRSMDRALVAHHPRFLIVDAKKARFDWASDDSDLVTTLVRYSRAGIPCLLIDVREISDRLVEKCAARPSLPARTYPSERYEEAVKVAEAEYV